MGIMCTIIIPPKGQQRVRSRVFKAGNRVASRTHKAPNQELEEERLSALLYEHRPPVPYQGPIMLGVKAYLPIPQGKSKKWKAAALAGQIRPTTKPDLDNLLKHLKDVCKGIFWGDDKQVVGYLPGTGKYYGDPPRWEIIIQEWGGENPAKKKEWSQVQGGDPVAGAVECPGGHRPDRVRV
jgi:Holliday junction resolvase RusA-like endonuclease